MNRVKNRIHKILIWEYLPHAILFLLILVLHFWVKLNTVDDAIFSNQLSSTTLFSWLKNRWLTWSSRMFIEGIMAIYLKLPHIVWIIFDSLIMTLGAIAVSKIFVYRNQRLLNWIIVFLFLLYPFTHMGSAGWIATSTNYIIPLSMGLIAVYPIKKVFCQNIINPYEYILYTFAILIATNQEQMAIILWSTYFSAVLYLFYQKKTDKYLNFSFVLCSGSILYIITCPGNAIRNIQEIGHWFSDYGMFSFIEKINLGFSSTMYHFIMTPNLIFITFCFLLSCGVFINYKDRFIRLISLFPLVTSLVFSLFIRVFSRIFPSMKNFIPTGEKYGIIHLQNFDAIKSYIPIIIMVFVFCIIILSLYLIFGNTKYSAISIFVFLIGTASRVIMGFSPTIYASSLRTYIFMYFAFVIISVMIINKLPSRYTSKIVLPRMAIISSVSYIYYLITIISL